MGDTKSHLFTRGNDDFVGDKKSHLFTGGMATPRVTQSTPHTPSPEGMVTPLVTQNHSPSPGGMVIPRVTQNQTPSPGEW